MPRISSLVMMAPRSFLARRALGLQPAAPSLARYLAADAKPAGPKPLTSAKDGPVVAKDAPIPGRRRRHSRSKLLNPVARAPAKGESEKPTAAKKPPQIPPSPITLERHAKRYHRQMMIMATVAPGGFAAVNAKATALGTPYYHTPLLYVAFLLLREQAGLCPAPKQLKSLLRRYRSHPHMHAAMDIWIDNAYPEVAVSLRETVKLRKDPEMDRNLKKALIQYAYRLTSRNLLLQLLSHADQSLGTTDINLLLLGFERASKDVQLKDSKQSLPQNLGVSLDGYAEADVERITQIIRTTLPKEVRKFVEVFPDNADLFFIPNLSDMLAARGEDQLALADFPSESGWGKDELAPGIWNELQVQASKSTHRLKASKRPPLTARLVRRLRRRFPTASKIMLRHMWKTLYPQWKEPTPRLVGTLQSPPGTSVDSPLERLPRDPTIPVPKLAHGLDSVITSKSVQWLQDPESNVYNFPPQIQSIPSVKSFDFSKVNGFIRSSQDPELRKTAIENQKRFTGSTSSLTFLLTHIYYLLARTRRVAMDFSQFSEPFREMKTFFTAGMQAPGSVDIKKVADNVYAFDGGSGTDEDYGLSNMNVLTWMGTMLEKYLTMSPEDFNTLLKSPAGTETKPSVAPEREAYQYSKSKNFIMRAQLDCIDERLPGTGVFDIKTRAAVAIRHDRLNFQQASGYQIVSEKGLFESFEREFFDLVKSAMIKYNFQARIGDMDGIFIAFHNTAKIFGFQYLSIEDMDKPLFGSKLAGDRAFSKSVELLDSLADVIARVSHGKDMRCVFQTKGPTLRIWLRGHGRSSVKELTVTAEHYANGVLCDKPPLTDPDLDWTVKYKVTLQTSLWDDMVWSRYMKARRAQRLISKMVLPPDINSPKEIRSLWEDVDFGGELQPPPKNISPATLRNLFMDPYPLVLQTRALAEEGRRRLALAAEGKAVEKTKGDDKEAAVDGKESKQQPE